MSEIKVGFRGLQVACIIGILSHERIDAQPLIVDLQARVRLTKRIEDDDNEDALQVDYSRLADTCRSMAVEGKFRLLEALASRMCDRILDDHAPHVVSVTVRLRKPNAIADAVAFVELTKP